MHRQLYQVVLGIAFLLRAATAQTPPVDSSRRNSSKLAHPGLIVVDDNRVGPRIALT